VWSVVEVVGLGVASCDGFGGRGGQKMQKQKQGIKTRQTVSSFFFVGNTKKTNFENNSQNIVFSGF
jgi:hypothetical protein